MTTPTDDTVTPQPPEEPLAVPATAELPVEALLQLPPPTPPITALTPERLVEIAAMGYEDERRDPALEIDQEPPPEAVPSVRAEKLREALRQAPEALGKLKVLSPRNIAKDTVGRGIDVALEAGGLRIPTQTSEPE